MSKLPRLHQVLAPKMKKKIIEIKDQNPKTSQKELGDIIKQTLKVEVNRRTLCDILKEHEKWRNFDKEGTRKYDIRTNGNLVKLEEALYMWMVSARNKNVIINMDILKTKARYFGANLDVASSFKFSNGWLQKFLKRYSIKNMSLHGEAATNNIDQIENEKLKLQDILKNYEPEDIYNMDECALFYQLKPNRTYCTKTKCSNTKESKKRVTLVICCNATGSDKIPLTMIGFSKKPRAFKCFNTSAYLDYTHNQKAWMTSAVFNMWLEKLDCDMLRKKRKIILILDNAPSHIIRTTLLNVKIVYIPPNYTSSLQPLDGGIIAALKKRYKTKLCQHLIMNLETNNESKVTLKNCVKWIHSCWEEIGTTTIQNCWKHTGILNVENNDRMNPDLIEEEKIELDEIERFITLNEKGDAIDIESYINFDESAFTNDNYSMEDEEIVEFLKCDEDESDIEMPITVSNGTNFKDVLQHLDYVIKFLDGNADTSKTDIISIFNLKRKIEILQSKAMKQQDIRSFLNKN